VIERVEGIHIGGEEGFVGPGKAAEFDPLPLIYRHQWAGD
jgi:arginine decarboxylase